MGFGVFKMLCVFCGTSSISLHQKDELPIFSLDINKLTFQHIPLLTKQINCPSYLSQTNAMGTFNILNGEDRRVAGELMNRCKLFVLNVCHVEWDGPSSCMASSDDIVASFERGLYLAIILCPSSSQYYPSFFSHSLVSSFFFLVLVPCP